MSPEMDLGIGLTLFQQRDGQELPSTRAHPTELDTLQRSAPLTVAKTRRRKTSRLPIDCLLPEILILIATHLGGDYTMLINLTHVCAHWRWVITNCPTLWTRISISFGGGSMPCSLANVFLERADECMLDVRFDCPKIPRRSLVPGAQVIPTLSPGKRIRTLHIAGSWFIVAKVLGMWADALSPLQVLEINAHGWLLTSQSTIFDGDTLKELKLLGCAVPALGYIRAPNLTTFTVSDCNNSPCSATRILDFLEAAPALGVVSIYNNSRAFEFPSPKRIVTLPHVRHIELGMTMARAPRLASSLICPSATDTNLADMDMLPNDPNYPIFPPSLHQLLERYSVEMIDRVVMRVSDKHESNDCSLQFHSPSDAKFGISCEIGYTSDLLPLGYTPDFLALLDGTVLALSSLPLSNVVKFSIDIQPYPPDFTADPAEITTKLAVVFEKCPRLNEVVLEHFPPHCLPLFSGDRTLPVRVLVIKHSEDDPWEDLVEHITEVAWVRHSRGVPFKGIEIVTATEKRSRMEELEGLVEEVKYRVEPSQKNDDAHGPEFFGFSYSTYVE